MFNSLSRQVVVSGSIASPASVLTDLLSNIVTHLGNDLVGHAKAVAHVEGGVFHASTTGADAGVDVKAVGSPSTAGDTFQLDFMCVFHGQRYRKLVHAWNSAVATLAASGLNFTPVESVNAISRAPRTTLPIMGSLASSFLVLKPCCVIPLLWSVSGGGMAFLQVFEPLEPYRPVFMAITLALLSAAFYRLYFAAGTMVSESIRSSVRKSRGILWFATAIFLVSTFYPIFAPQQHPALHRSADHIHH
jgi:mercuric ion transport protein